MSNKYDGNGELKQPTILLGLVELDGKVQIIVKEDTPISEVARFWGMLSVEVPFLVQQEKMKAFQKSQAEKRVITPN